MNAEEIVGIISGVSAGVVAVVTAIGTIINNRRRKEGNYKCCLTGRKLKPRKKKNAHSNKNASK